MFRRVCDNPQRYDKIVAYELAYGHVLGGDPIIRYDFPAGGERLPSVSDSDEEGHDPLPQPHTVA